MNFRKLLLAVVAIAVFGVQAPTLTTQAAESGWSDCQYGAIAEASECDRFQTGITGHAAFKGPNGENVVVWCVNGWFVYAAQPNGRGGIYTSGSVFPIRCNIEELRSFLPGHRAVVVTDPRFGGWVVDIHEQVAFICQAGLLTSISGSAPGEAPKWRSTPEENVCGKPSAQA